MSEVEVGQLISESAPIIGEIENHRSECRIEDLRWSNPINDRRSVALQIRKLIFEIFRLIDPSLSCLQELLACCRPAPACATYLLLVSAIGEIVHHTHEDTDCIVTM